MYTHFPSLSLKAQKHTRSILDTGNCCQQHKSAKEANHFNVTNKTQVTMHKQYCMNKPVTFIPTN